MNGNGDPRWLARLRAFSSFSSLFVIAVGSAGLAGWALGVPQLRTMLPGLIAMKANTAVCLILIGVALWLRRTPVGAATVQNAAAKVLALVVTVVGGLSFAEYLSGWDFGIDQLLFVENAIDSSVAGHPGLMSPITAAVFVLVGIALLSLDWRPRGVWPAQVASVVAMMACLLAVLDFVLGTRATHTRIALQTTVALLVLSIAVPCARPQWGMGRLLASTSMGGMLARRLLPLSVVIPILIGWFRWYAEIRGLYSDCGGVAVMILSMVVLLVGISGWTAYVIDRTDQEREAGAQQLRISEERFRLLVDGLKDYAIYMLDAQGQVASWNAGAEAITGFAAAEVMGRPCSVFYTEQDRAAHRLQQELHTAVETGRYEEQVQRMRKDGSLFWANILVAPLYNPDGGLRGFAKIVRDITVRKHAELALELQRQRFEAVLENLPAMICLLTPDYHVAFANRAFRKQFGESQGRKCFEYCFGRSEACEFCETYQVLKSNVPHDWEVSTPDGRRIHAFDFPFADSNGSPLILEMDIDITDQRKAEEELRSASRYARSLIEASLDPLVTISKDGKIMDVNQATEAATGIARERLIGSDFSVYFTQPEKARAGYEQVFATGTVRDYPLALRHTSGDIMDVLYNATVYKNEAGEVEGVFAAARDITQRKQAETALQYSEQRYRSLVVATSQVVWTTNADGEVAGDMPMWRNFTGQTFEQIQGWGWIESVAPEDRERTAVVWRRAVNNRILYDTDYRMRRRDGEYRYMAVRGVPVLEPDGSIREWIGTCTDITERRKAEQEIRTLNEELEQRVVERTAQLEASNKELEAFTYSVSHDLRAPLRHITGFAKMLVEDYQATLDENAKHCLLRISEGVQRMGQLVDDLLNLARVGRKELGLQVTGLSSIVQEVVAELQPEIAGRQVEWKIANLPFVECDPALMKQVFQNLLSNAVKFTRPRAQAVIEVNQGEEQGESLIVVRDNGVGFSMKYADKLFGVFQRLHRAEDFEGTGVGLATVQRIIAKHGGRIWAEAELDKGATFYFTLRTSEAKAEKEKAAVAGAQS